MALKLVQYGIRLGIRICFLLRFDGLLKKKKIETTTAEGRGFCYLLVDQESGRLARLLVLGYSIQAASIGAVNSIGLSATKMKIKVKVLILVLIWKNLLFTDSFAEIESRSMPEDRFFLSVE